MCLFYGCFSPLTTYMKRGSTAKPCLFHGLGDAHYPQKLIFLNKYLGMVWRMAFLDRPSGEIARRGRKVATSIEIGSGTYRFSANQHL